MKRLLLTHILINIIFLKLKYFLYCKEQIKFYEIIFLDFICGAILEIFGMRNVFYEIL